MTRSSLDFAVAAVVAATAACVLAASALAEVVTPLANLTSWSIEGPWRWITAIGVRMSIRHRDITFGGSPRGGVRVDFREPVKVGPFHPPALYVTVEDLEGLGAALTAAGVPGGDRR